MKAPDVKFVLAPQGALRASKAQAPREGGLGACTGRAMRNDRTIRPASGLKRKP